VPTDKQLAQRHRVCVCVCVCVLGMIIDVTCKKGLTVWSVNWSGGLCVGAAE